MKKLLLILSAIFALCGSLNAETNMYKTTGFAYKYIDEYGRWTDWSKWQTSDMVVTIDLSNDVVKIFSPQPQTYAITEHVRNYTDESGGKQSEYKFIDQDGDVGTMRLRMEKNGNSQIYIQFADVIWVYNVKKIS